jgi:WD40 repeat protein
MLVDMYSVNGIQAGDQGENGRATLWFANAALQGQADPERQRANVIRVRTWGRRAFTPLRAFVADGSWPAGIIFHPQGHHLITQRMIDGKTRDVSNTLWELDTEESLLFPGGLKEVPAAAWSPDGRTLAAGHTDGDVIIAGFPGAQEVARIPFPGRIRRLTYSADGHYLAIAGGSSARVWDCRTSAFATPELVHPAAVKTMAFHPEGRYLATGCGDDRARLFAVPSDTEMPIWPAVPHVQPASRNITDLWYCGPPLFINGGRGLITYGGKRGLTWRALETGAEIRTLDSPEFSARVVASLLSPDGRYLAAYSIQYPSCVRLFEAATGRPVGPVLWHKNNVFSMSFSPDSRMLVTGSSDNTAQLWAVPGGEPMSRPLDLHRTVNLVAFGPDGRSLATQDGDLVRLWQLPQEGLPIARLHADSNHSFAALSPNTVR